MSNNTAAIGAVKVHLDAPTELTFSDLHDWVLWQFPLQRGGWLDAAAHPADPEYGWIPARVQPLKQLVLLYANCPEQYSSPEEAARRIAELVDL